MVVDGGIHEGVSEAITELSGAVIATVRQAVAATLGPSQGPPAAPIGDSSEFLDVLEDADQEVPLQPLSGQPP